MVSGREGWRGNEVEGETAWECAGASAAADVAADTGSDKEELTDEQKAINHKMKLKVEKDKDALPLAQDMLRYEFIEFLIRVARAKYIETG